MPKRTLTQLQNTHSNRNKVASAVAWSQCFIHIALFGYSERRMIQLQGVNRILYKRVAQWVKIVKVVAIRLSEVACPNYSAAECLSFQQQLRSYSGVERFISSLGFKTTDKMVQDIGSTFSFPMETGQHREMRKLLQPTLPIGCQLDLTTR